MLKKIVGYIIIVYLIINVLSVAGLIYLNGVSLFVILPLVQTLYITVFLLSGANNWIHGKAWGNPHKELQAELAKTRKWE